MNDPKTLKNANEDTKILITLGELIIIKLIFFFNGLTFYAIINFTL